MASIAACRTLIPALAQFLYAKGRAALDVGSAHLAFSSWGHSRLCLPPLSAPQPRTLRSPEPTRPPSPHLSAIAPAVRVWRPTGPSEQKSAVQCGNRVLDASTAGPCRESPPDVLRYLLHGGWGWGGFYSQNLLHRETLQRLLWVLDLHDARAAQLTPAVLRV